MSIRCEMSAASSKEAQDLRTRVGEERAQVCCFIVDAFNLNPADLSAIERGLAY